MDLVEVVLLGVGGEHLRHTGVEPTSEDRRQAGLLEPLAVGPLPRILEVRLFRRLVVRRVKVRDAGGKAGVHDREVLVRERDVHHEVGLVFLDERRRGRHVHGVELRGRDFRRRSLRGVPRALLDVRLDRLAPRLGAGRDQQLAERFGVLGHLRGRHAGDAAGADENHSCHASFPSLVAFISRSSENPRPDIAEMPIIEGNPANSRPAVPMRTVYHTSRPPASNVPPAPSENWSEQYSRHGIGDSRGIGDLI